MHERILTSLRSVANVWLVASLRDDRIGFPSRTDARVFIPDLHLLSRKGAQQYSYSTNETQLLGTVLNTLVTLRNDARSRGEVFVVYQLGDYLDLWREAPTDMEEPRTIERILRDHREIVEAFTMLKFRFVLGNHDFELHRAFPAWDRRYYLTSTEQPIPRGVVLHGDLFDWVEGLPDALSRWAVYFFGPHFAASDYDLGDLKNLMRRQHGRKTYRREIKPAADLGSLERRDADGPIPDRWNVQQEGLAGADVGFLDLAQRLCSEVNARYQQDLRFVACAHTHHARIAVRDAGNGSLFTLMDCGAWVGNCSDTSGEMKMGNAQIGVLHNNEARIYQLGPLT
jgi:UDP-2,3-diacylglucosamine pyrophosphatase LpxH